MSMRFVFSEEPWGVCAACGCDIEAGEGYVEVGPVEPAPQPMRWVNSPHGVDPWPSSVLLHLHCFVRWHGMEALRALDEVGDRSIQSEFLSEESLAQGRCGCRELSIIWDDAAARYADGHLEQVEIRASGWEVVHLCPVTGSRWLEDHVHGEQQGGGSRRLRRIAAEAHGEG